MKKTIFSAVILCLLIQNLVAQYSKVDEVTIESKELDQTREIMIHTPLNYIDNPNTYFNVIYVFDSQNRRFFDFISSLAMLSKESGQGFIVIGVKSTIITEEVDGQTKFLYGRNDDLLPADTKFMGGRKGNIDAFQAYVKNEVIPYVESNYRVLPGRMAVGHSLSASFLVYSLINEPEMFDYYVNVSPNVEYDDEYLVRRLRDLDPDAFNSTKYVYMSHGNEFEYWGWGKANQNAYTVLGEKAASEKLKITIEEYPDEGHMSTFIPSVLSAMRPYMETIRNEWNSMLSDNQYNVTFRLEVPNENDVIYISGNQDSLGDWAEDKIKMESVAPLVREVMLSVHDHVEVKFFRDDKSQAWIKVGKDGKSTYPMMLRPEAGGVYTFKVDGYSN